MIHVVNQWDESWDGNYQAKEGCQNTPPTNELWRSAFGVGVADNGYGALSGVCVTRTHSASGCSGHEFLQCDTKVPM